MVVLPIRQSPFVRLVLYWCRWWRNLGRLRYGWLSAIAVAGIWALIQSQITDLFKAKALEIWRTPAEIIRMLMEVSGWIGAHYIAVGWSVISCAFVALSFLTWANPRWLSLDDQDRREIAFRIQPELTRFLERGEVLLRAWYEDERRDANGHTHHLGFEAFYGELTPFINQALPHSGAGAVVAVAPMFLHFSEQMRRTIENLRSLIWNLDTFIDRSQRIPMS